MAGSTEMCETATVNWPGPGAGTSSSVSDQSVARGSPLGRAASRTWWFVIGTAALPPRRDWSANWEIIYRAGLGHHRAGRLGGQEEDRQHRPGRGDAARDQAAD